MTVETVTAGSQHSGGPLLLPGPQSPHLVSVDRGAVPPGALLTCVSACGPFPRAVPFCSPFIPEPEGNPCTAILIACDGW